MTENEIITQTENFYFYITEFFHVQEGDVPFDEKETLEKIKERIIELENLNEFNKEPKKVIWKD